MKSKVIAASLVLLVTAGALLFAMRQGEVEAQDTGYEYAYLLPVPRLESYEIDLSRWAGSAEDKKYMESHVFVYEEGTSAFDKRVNSLRKLNELAAQGWELHDAEAGVLRRRR